MRDLEVKFRYVAWLQDELLNLKEENRELEIEIKKRESQFNKKGEE